MSPYIASQIAMGAGALAIGAVFVFYFYALMIEPHQEEKIRRQRGED